MAYRSYLFIPLYPILAIVCLLVFTYERLALNEQERVDNTFTATRIFFLIWNGISMIISFPAVFLDLLCGCGALIRWPINLILSPFLILWGLLRHFIWDALFGEIVRDRYSSWNNRVYQALPQHTRQIRVLEIVRGSSSNNLKARLINVNLDADHNPYEALSYSWGGHLMLRRIITVNDRSYFVADTVFNALKELRLPDKERLLWIDAICINQGNSGERSQQVAMMGAIYQSAKAVIVWLGKATDQSECAFNFAEKAAIAEPSGLESICADPSTWQPPLQAIMRNRWWCRVWIVQEVVLADDVRVKSGHHEIAWETLVICLKRLSQIDNHGLDRKVISFVNDVCELKHSDTDSTNDLLKLALRFRDRVAGDPRDKLIGFCGLLKSAASEIPTEPYVWKAPELFAHSAAKWVGRGGSLAVIALAENRATHRNSTVLDWVAMTSKEWKDQDPLALDEYAHAARKKLTIDFWNDELLPSISAKTGRKYSATQNVPATFREEKPNWKSIYLTGWQHDIIEHRGDTFENVQNAAGTIRNWEKLAGGPWTDAMHSDRVRFIRTLVADTRQEILPQNRPELFQEWLIKVGTGDHTAARDLEPQPSSPESNRGLFVIEQVIMACCYNRCFFVTENGCFGLGPARTNIRDRVCLLLGSDVPFILMHLGGQKFYFKGQAYVDGLMEYQGDLTEDLRSNSLKTREFRVQ